MSGPRPDAMDLVGLRPLMDMTSGSADVVVAMIDGPIAFQHPALAPGVGPLFVEGAGDCVSGSSPACRHGTFIAGILFASRESGLGPAICPGCTLLNRPILREDPGGGLYDVVPAELSRSIIEVIDQGAMIVNLSLSVSNTVMSQDRQISDALDYALNSGAVVVAATGNEGLVSSSTITRHPAVVPVVSYDAVGNPAKSSNLSATAARRGIGAPGVRIQSLDSAGGTIELSGTSFAAAFVTGVSALLWSLFPRAGPAQIKAALIAGEGRRKRSAMIPPLLSAPAAVAFLNRTVP